MASSYAPVLVRVSTPADIEEIVATMTTAFFDDPLWGPAFPDVERRVTQASAMWRLFVTLSLRYPWTLVAENIESAAPLFPLGGAELTEDEQSGLEECLIGITSRTVADGILAISDQFEAARPSEPPFYLSLLATHDDHRGAGLGMGLLKEISRALTALGAAAYLESCNPANNERYQSVGFTSHAQITIASGHVVTTMWRSSR